MTDPMTDAEIYAKMTRLCAIDATAATAKDHADIKALIHAQLANVGVRLAHLQDSHAALIADAKIAARILEEATRPPIMLHPPATIAGRLAAARAILEVAIAQAEAS